MELIKTPEQLALEAHAEKLAFRRRVRALKKSRMRKSEQTHKQKV